MFSVLTLEQFSETNYDVILIGLTEKTNHPSSLIRFLDERLDGQISTLIHEKELKGKLKEVTELFTFGKVNGKKLLFVGLGKEEELSLETLREGVAAAFNQIRNQGVVKAAILFDTFVFSEDHFDDFAVLLSETLGLCQYKIDDYKEKSNEVDKRLEKVDVITNYSKEEVEKLLHIGHVFANGTNKARALVNTPANLMTPTDIAKVAEELASTYSFEIEIMEKDVMEKLGMGALLAVAKGSEEPPKLIVLKYKGLEKWEDVTAFVGKGLTFDSGGYSLKPREGMEEMKMDMGGAAAVLGAMEIIGELKPKANVIAVIPSTENLINGAALKPGDVIASLSGKTIEVKNTDAEGRLILADGVTYAKQLGANRIVDVATLTGAVMIALGEYTTGAITNDEEWMEDVLHAAIDAGEWVWRLPNYQPYKEMLKTSDVADLNNAPGRLAGAITAGLFIGEFVGDTPWVHLDIAGTGWHSKSSSIGPKGGTGAMVRTLARLIMNRSY